MNRSSLLTYCMMVLVVAAMGRMIVRMAREAPAERASPRFQARTLPRGISPEKGRELQRQYGEWAVNLAEAWCPFGDVQCIEREAGRLQERIMRYRR